MSNSCTRAQLSYMRPELYRIGLQNPRWNMGLGFDLKQVTPLCSLLVPVTLVLFDASTGLASVWIKHPMYSTKKRNPMLNPIPSTRDPFDLFDFVWSKDKDEHPNRRVMSWTPWKSYRVVLDPLYYGDGIFSFLFIKDRKDGEWWTPYGNGILVEGDFTSVAWGPQHVITSGPINKCLWCVTLWDPHVKDLLSCPTSGTKQALNVFYYDVDWTLG